MFFKIIAQVKGVPQFDISIKDTQVYSLKSGWNNIADQAFLEVVIFLMDGSVSICFHDTGNGDPAILFH